MTAVQMPSTIPLPQNPNVMAEYLHLPGDMRGNGRNMQYFVRHENSRRRYDHHQEQSLPQEQREKEVLHQRHLENKSKKKYNNNKQTAAETIGVGQVKVKSEMACGPSDPNRANNTTKPNDRKRTFEESSGSECFDQNSGQMSYSTTHTSEDRMAKKQCTSISINIVDNSSNSTNVKVTTTIQSQSDTKQDGGSQNNSSQSYVSNVVDIRQAEEGGESAKNQSQNGDLGSSSDIGNLFDVNSGGDSDVIKLIEQGDMEKLMKVYGNGNVQNIEELLTKIIDESNQELKECTAPGSNLPANQEKGEIKEEESKKSTEEVSLKVEQPQSTNMNPRMEPPPNMNVSEAFPMQPLPSIRELKNPTTSSAMPPASGFNNTLKVENSVQNVPSVVYPQSNSMPRVPMSSALSGMAVSLSAPHSHVLTNTVQHPPANAIVNPINQASSTIFRSNHFDSTPPQSSRMPHRNSISNFPNRQQSNRSNQLAQILKGQQGITSILPTIASTFQKCSANGITNNRQSGMPVSNNATYMPNSQAVRPYPQQGQNYIPEQFKALLLDKKRQQQALNQGIRGPPPPYTTVQPNAPPNYSPLPGRNIPGILNRSLSAGMQGISGGIPQENINGQVHLGAPATLQQPQMPGQMVPQVRHRPPGISGMRQMIPQRTITNRNMIGGQQSISMPLRQRMGLRAQRVGCQDQMMPQPQQQQTPQMPIHQMRRMVGSTPVQQMNAANCHPHATSNNLWQNSSTNDIQSMNSLPMQPHGMNQQSNSSMNQFHGLNSSMQTVVNVQTSQNTSQNINIQTSVQAVLHQPQQGSYNSMNNQQRLLQHQQQQQQQQAVMQSRMAQAAAAAAAPNMTLNQVSSMGMGTSHSNQGMMGTVQMGGNLRTPGAVQSSSSIDLDLLDNIIRKDP